jgi:hypothetical protein
MTVVAAETSSHLALYFVLLSFGAFNQNDRLPNFNTVITKARESNKFSPKVLEDADWLMHARNALAHPEEWIIAESTPVPNDFGIAWYETTIKKKFDTAPVKQKVFFVSTSNHLRLLRQIAEEAIKRTENILGSTMGTYDYTDVNQWKIQIEKGLGGFDLEKIP